MELPVPDSTVRATITGILHLFVAFDVGEEVDLERARQLAPAEIQALPRRRRTPSSFGYRPAPLRFALGPVFIELLEIGPVQTFAEATLFDFAGFSVALRIPFQLTPEALTRLADSLANPVPVIEVARAALTPLVQRLRPAIQKLDWSPDLSEEYFVLQLPPGQPLTPQALLNDSAPWLAGLLRLDDGKLSQQEITEALRLRLAYSPDDLFVPDWGVTVLLDRDCDETLLTIEFTNLQLLEYRHIDGRLTESVATASRLIQTPKRRPGLPFLRSYARSLRALGELKIDANELFERTANVFKLVGDQYLARVHSLLARRFHLDEWEQGIQRKLNVLQGVYEALSDQTDTARAEFLEVIVILLILIEVAVSLFRIH